LKRTVLAAGADLKNAPALGRGRDIYLAPYIGDLEDPLTRRDFERQIDKILSLYDVRPETLVYDLHPGYHSTRWALEQAVESKVGVQHHHAHLLSVMAEHNLEEAIGLSFDGTGFGTDGTIWGGEFMLSRRDGFQRLGHFLPFMLPGGEAAVLHPLRIALALLRDLLSPRELERLFCERLGLPEQQLATLGEMIDRGVNAPVTSSLGRIFDAAGALLGLVDRVSYEGEGPIRLEGLALGTYDGKPLDASAACEDWHIRVEQGDGPFRIDCRGLLRHLAQSRGGGTPGGDSAHIAALALEFHRGIAAAALEGARRMGEQTGITRIAVSGGVFQNVLLSELLLPALRASGFEVFAHENLPPGDGGIAVGQVYFLPGND
jgi:hydrogenase maturation protein HypF